MVIRSLKLIDYRNYTHQEVSFSAGINVITGENAQGKTNLVEAVVLSCIGRSPRTPRDKELIRWNAPHAYVCCTGERKYGKVKVETFLTHTENKRISINGLPIRKLGELMGNLNAVYFTPDELKIVKSGQMYVGTTDRINTAFGSVIVEEELTIDIASEQPSVTNVRVSQTFSDDDGIRARYLEATKPIPAAPPYPQVPPPPGDVPPPVPA